MMTKAAGFHVANTIVPMIDAKVAERIDGACFVDGNDDEFVVEFWSLWGAVIRSVYNRRTTGSEFFFVTGEDADRVKLCWRNFVGAGI